MEHRPVAAARVNQLNYVPQQFPAHGAIRVKLRLQARSVQRVVNPFTFAMRVGSHLKE